MLVPTPRAALVTLPGELAARIGAERVLVAFDEDDLFDGVYRHAATVTGKDEYEMSDRVPDLTMPEQQRIVDLARQARPGDYLAARHAFRGDPKPATEPVRRGHHVRYWRRGRHR